MQNDGDLGALNDSRLDELDEVGVVCIGARALGNLQNHRRMLFLARLGDALDDLHVVDVESADGVAAVVSLLEHFSSRYQRHSVLSFAVLN